MIFRFEEVGFIFVGKDIKGECMEIVEIKDYLWFVGV